MANLWSYKSGVAFWYRPMKSWLGGSPNSTHKNMPYRLDKLRSALAEAQLKRTITVCILVKNLHHGTSFFSLEYFRVTFSTTFFNISGFWFIVKHWSLTYLFLKRTCPVYKFVMKITKCPEDNCSQRWKSPCALVFLPITLQEAFSVNICLSLWNILQMFCLLMACILFFFKWW